MNEAGANPPGSGGSVPGKRWRTDLRRTDENVLEHRVVLDVVDEYLERIAFLRTAPAELDVGQMVGLLLDRRGVEGAVEGVILPLVLDARR